MNADTDSLSTPRGFVNGVALGLAFWLGCVLTAAAFVIARAWH